MRLLLFDLQTGLNFLVATSKKEHVVICGTWLIRNKEAAHFPRGSNVAPYPAEVQGK